MTQARTEKALLEALENNDYRVIVLSGEWGAGKSHLWNTVKDSPAIKELKPIYISAFGHQSLSSLKGAIVGNLLGEQLGKATKNNWLTKIVPILKNWASIISSKESIEIVEETTATILMPKLARRLLVIDDIERAIELPVNILLGFLNTITESYGAKVLLILNAEKLEKQNKENWDVLREKIFDIEIGLTTSSDEATSFGLTDHEFQKDIRTLISKTGITNVRAIKQVDREIKRLFLGKGVRSEHKNSLLPSTVAMILLHLKAIPKAPSIDYIIKINSTESEMFDAVHDLSSASKEDQSDRDSRIERDKWRKWLRDLSVGYPDKFEFEILIPYLKTGFLDSQKLTSYLADVDERIERENTERLLSDFWYQYHWETRIEKSDFKEKLKELCNRSKFLSTSSLSKLADLAAKEYDDKDLEMALVNAAIKGLVDDKISESGYESDIRKIELNTHIKKYIDERRKVIYPTPTLSSAISEFSKNRSIRSREVLNSATLDEVVFLLISSPPAEKEDLFNTMMPCVAKKYSGHGIDKFTESFVSACGEVIKRDELERLRNLILREYEQYGVINLVKNAEV